MIKNLKQLKEVLRSGAEYEVVEHYIHPQYTGQVRKATYVGSTVMYSQSVVQDDNINLLSDGKGIKTNIGKASDWVFGEEVILCIDRKRDRLVMAIKVKEAE